MSTITITSDYGTHDYSVAAVKGALYKAIDRLKIVDISHEITPYNIPEAAFILQAALPHFAKGTIHLIGVDGEFKTTQPHVLLFAKGQYFIGADNGIFSLLTEASDRESIIRIEHPKSKHSSFPMLDVFVDIAAQISYGEDLENLGNPVHEINIWHKNQPELARPDEIIGHIVYVDRYGNLVTDIDQKSFEKQAANRRFEILASNAKISKIHRNYHDFVDLKLDTKQRFQAGKALAIFNTMNLLEIALFKSNPLHGGSASDLLGLGVGDSIRVVFT